MAGNARGDSQDPRIPGDPFDFIVVGGGTSGCVLASRLTENPDCRVLLIEAGPDAPPGLEHPDIRDPYPTSLANPRFTWPGLLAQTGAAPRGGDEPAFMPFLQARVLGGASSINGMFAERGFPADYDEWNLLGADGWSWQEVLPYFNKLENVGPSPGPRGTSGPLPLFRLQPSGWAPFAAAFAAALVDSGAAMVDDDVEFRDGISSASMNIRAEQRASASMVYLTREVRARRNLTIITDASVDRVLISDQAARGVSLRTASGTFTAHSREVIVSAGAIYSPALLLRSGIGPAAALSSLGIPVLRDLPGVGMNLQNHPILAMTVHLRRSGMQPRHQRFAPQNLYRFSSGVPGCPSQDMEMLAINRSAWHPLGRRIGTVLVVVNKPCSTGRVELASADPTAAPVPRFNLLGDPRDFDRMVHGVRRAATLLQSRPIRAIRNEAIVPDGRIAGALARRTTANWLRARAISAVLDMGVTRRLALARHSLDLDSLLRDEGDLRQFVRDCAQAAYHATGTCRMGRQTDPMTVVDAHCRVHGIGGLRVVDASVFPTLPRAGTHLPVLMVAEAMADRIARERLLRG